MLAMLVVVPKVTKFIFLCPLPGPPLLLNSSMQTCGDQHLILPPQVPDIFCCSWMITLGLYGYICSPPRTRFTSLLSNLKLLLKTSFRPPLNAFKHTMVESSLPSPGFYLFMVYSIDFLAPIHLKKMVGSNARCAML